MKVSYGQYEYRVYRASVMMRGSLISCIYSKTLRLLESDAQEASALTLMNADIEVITQGVTQLHETWSSCLEVGLAIWLLERQVGAACAVPVGLTIGSYLPAVFDFSS